MCKNDKKIRIMKDEPIAKALLKLGIPTMIGMMISALYSVVDAYFVGGLGTSQLGAVSIVFPIGQVIIGLGMMFGSGGASYIARLLGEKQSDRANNTAVTALVSSLMAGILLITVSLCFLDNILTALGATETILPYARSYATIYIAGAMFNIFNVTMNNIVTAEGAAKLTMASMLTGGFLNAVLDPIFIYPLGFGIKGAAIATVISQAVTSILYVWYIKYKKGYLRFSLKFFALDKTIYSQIFKVGVPTFTFQLFTSIAIGITNSKASTYSDSAIAAMGIVTRIMALGTFIVFGYMKGFQPIAGYNYSAKRYDRLKKSINLSLIWSTIFCCFVGLVFIICPSSIISLFSSNVEVISLGIRALRANGVMFTLFGFQLVYGTLFLALGKAKEGGLLSMSRQALFFIPIIFILPKIIGVNGIIYAQPAADILAIILTFVFAVKFKKSINQLMSKKGVSL